MVVDNMRWQQGMRQGEYIGPIIEGSTAALRQFRHRAYPRLPRVCVPRAEGRFASANSFRKKIYITNRKYLQKKLSRGQSKSSELIISFLFSKT